MRLSDGLDAKSTEIYGKESVVKMFTSADRALCVAALPYVLLVIALGKPIR